jgi:hypothetical protein
MVASVVNDAQSSPARREPEASPIKNVLSVTAKAVELDAVA